MTASANAAFALRELKEVSSQIEDAIVVDAAGTVIASTFEGEEAGARVAAGASALLAAAEERVGGGRARVSHLVAEADRGAVFVVRSDGGTITALTGAEPTASLVFYDLKVTLRDATAPRAEGADA